MNTQQLVSFGNYLLSAERRERINSDTDKVHDADVANWKDSLPAVELTRGQQVMSVSFNPGQREDVAAIKQIFADAYDEIDKWVKVSLDKANADAQPIDDVEKEFTLKIRTNDISRLAAVAKTNLETAQMYAVKAVTR